jgi:hypothetical protein
MRWTGADGLPPAPDVTVGRNQEAGTRVEMTHRSGEFLSPAN